MQNWLIKTLIDHYQWEEPLLRAAKASLKNFGSVSQDYIPCQWTEFTRRAWVESKSPKESDKDAFSCLWLRSMPLWGPHTISLLVWKIRSRATNGEVSASDIHAISTTSSKCLDTTPSSAMPKRLWQPTNLESSKTRWSHMHSISPFWTSRRG